MSRYALFYIVFLIWPYCVVFACDNIVVETNSGKISGVTQTNPSGDTFCAFKGIPYAKPPVGALRFKDSVPIEPWDGVFEAKEKAQHCPQLNLIVKVVDGKEDCLYLNVYSRRVDPNLKLPVIFFIHPGFFIYGAGDEQFFGPDFFMMREDIMFVTFNYRLGILGFLDLEDEETPGNMGLKDQVLALKWVRENIASFGGDPDQITLFGQNVGAVSAHLMAFSPMTKGLFNKIILQSGSIFNPWALIAEQPKQVAYKFCEKLGKSVSNSQEVLEFLMSQEIHTLIETQDALYPVEIVARGILPFGPTSDSEAKNPFMPDEPLVDAEQGIDLPMIIGHNNREAIILLARMGHKFDKFNDDDFSKFLHPETVRAIQKYGLTANDLKKMYYGDDEISRDNHGQLIDLFSDLYIIDGVHKIIKLQTQKSSKPTYFYQYSFDKGFSPVKFFTGSHLQGAAHGDELTSEFRIVIVEKLLHKFLKQDTPSWKLMEQMVNMWVNFAVTGNPTPSTSDLLPVEWKPVSDASNLDYMALDETLEMKTMPNIEKLFLDSSSKS
ncbi:esterase FE4-like [Trichogramma pretiosum]|uniref:Carboxylesterase type B domain-containing protein n=1 Tax=Trichogramma kaykai TaxID=54128 RepID=A0ABD2W072_9HYME|nr:esterase FE4-like [Trichogramma pretiosum]